MSRKTKIAFILLAFAAVMAVVLLFVYQKYFIGSDETPKEILDKYIEVTKETKSMSAEGQIKVNVEGEGIEIPIVLNLLAYTNMNDKAYTEIDMTLAFMGNGTETNTKSYMEKTEDKVITYTNTNDEGWQYSESGNIASMKIDKIIEKLDFINDIAKVETEKNGITLNIDLSKVTEEQIKKMISGESLNETVGQFTESLNMGKITGNVLMKFNKEYELEIIEIKNVTAKAAEGNTSDNAMLTALSNASIKIEGKISLADYNSLDEALYTIPEDIGKEENKKDSNKETESNTEETQKRDDVILDEWGNEVGKDDISNETGEKTNAYRFKLNDNTITLPYDYASLKSLGWNVNFSDYDIDEKFTLNAYQRVSANLEAKNAEYNNPIIIGLENRSDEPISISDSKVWSMEIETENTAPSISINGLNWHSVESDIYSFLGDPDSIEEYSDGRAFIYKYEEGDYVTILEIYISEHIYKVKIYRE